MSVYGQFFGNARVWAGVHWRGSSVAGRDLGRKVGAHLLDRAPRRRARR